MPAPADARRGAFAALLLPILLWSYNWIVMKRVLAFAGPFDFSALRYVCGAAVLFGALLARGGPLRPPPLAQTAAIGLAQTAGFQALVQWALVEGGAGRTAILAYTMPFWVVPLGAWLLGERTGRRERTGLAVAAAGLLCVLEPWRGLGGWPSAALAIAGGFCWALGVVLSKRLFQRSDVDALSLTTWQMAFGALALALLAAVVPEKPIVWSAPLYGALAYNALLASGLAWLVWSWVVERLPAGAASLASLAVPIAGIGFAWALLGERPSAAELAGVALIAAALAIVNLRRARAP